MLDATAQVRAALYARVSGREQVENTSLEHQEARLRAHCQVMGWEAVGVYVDKAESGAKASRPEINRLMDDAKAGLFDKIVVLKLDRWSRSLTHLSSSIDELTEWDVSLVSVLDSFDSGSPNGVLLKGLLGGISEMERVTIRERTLSGRRSRARDGAWPGGNLPLGYQLVDHPELGRKAGGRVAVHDPEERATILRMVELLLDHDKTTGQIAATLNAEERPAKKGGRWTHQMVSRILCSDVLLGNYVFARPDPRHGTGINAARDPQRDRRRFEKVTKRVNGQELVVRKERKRGTNGEPITVQLPPLIDPETFEQVQRKLAATSFGRRSLPDRFYSLSGFLWFPCSQEISGAKAHGIWRDQGGPEGTRRMRCANAKTTASHPEKCDCPALLERPLADAVWQVVVDLIADPNYLTSLAAERLERLGDEPGMDLPTIDAKIEQQEGRMAAEVLKLVSAGLDAAVLEKVRGAMQADLNILRARRSELMESEEVQRTAEAATDRLAVVALSGREKLMDLDDESRSKVYALLGLEVRISDFGVPNGKLSMRRPPTFELSGRLSHNLVETLLVSPTGTGDLGGAHTPPHGPRRR